MLKILQCRYALYAIPSHREHYQSTRTCNQVRTFSLGNLKAVNTLPLCCERADEPVEVCAELPCCRIGQVAWHPNTIPKILSRRHDCISRQLLTITHVQAACIHSLQHSMRHMPHACCTVQKLTALQTPLLGQTPLYCKEYIEAAIQIQPDAESICAAGQRTCIHGF